MQTHLESLDRLAQRDPSLRFRTDELGVVRHLHGQLRPPLQGTSDLGRVVEESGITFLSEHCDLFGDVNLNEMVMLSSDTDPAGGANAVLEQRYDGHRVIGGSIRFHVDGAGMLDTISNQLFPDLGRVPHEPKINADQAIHVLHEATQSNSKPATTPEIVVMRHEGRPYLAWEVRLEINNEERGTRNESTQWVGYIDSQTGHLLEHYNNISSDR